MYSTPKYKANMVSSRTNTDETRARLSIQKTKFESIKSKQKNQRPKSIYEQVPWQSMRYSSLSEVSRTVENVIIDPQKVPIGPNQRLNININRQCKISAIGANDIILTVKEIFTLF